MSAATPPRPGALRSRRVAALCGSLRHGSFNRRLLEAAVAVAPDGLRIDEIPIRDLPLYDADLDGAEPPATVVELRARLDACDGLLVFTPEYNHAVPGGLTNAIDWASRPHGAGPLAWLPAGVLSTSPAATGGARGQAVLKLMLDSCLAMTYPHPGFVLGRARERFDPATGTLDADARSFLRTYLDGFHRWIERVGDDVDH